MPILSDPPWMRFRRRKADTTATPVTGIHSPSIADTALAPSYRGIAAQNEVAIGRSVRGGTWQQVAQLANWLAGRGTMDVPSYAPGVSVDEGETHTFRWRIKPRYQTTRYALSLRITSATPVIQTIDFEGSAFTIEALPRSIATNRVVYVDRIAQSSAVDELTLSITGADSQPGGAALVEMISVEALPRSALVCDDNDCGMQPELERPRRPIINRTIHDALIDRLDNLRDATRRPGMLQFARSDLDPWSFNSGSPVAFFQDGFSLLTPCTYAGQTTGAAEWAALVKCSTGATEATIDVSNVSTGAAIASVVVPANTTSWTWIDGDPFDVDAEDNTTPTGLRLGRTDDHTITCTRTAGAGTISVATLSIWS